MESYFVLALIFGIVFDAIAASQFNEIAKMKGHPGYFWWCFWMGPAGWAMVIALPVVENAATMPEDLPEL